MLYKQRQRKREKKTKTQRERRKDKRRKYFLHLLSLYNHIKNIVGIVFLIAMLRSLSRALKWYDKLVHEREVQKRV